MTPLDWQDVDFTILHQNEISAPTQAANDALAELNEDTNSPLPQVASVQLPVAAAGEGTWCVDPWRTGGKPGGTVKQKEMRGYLMLIFNSLSTLTRQATDEAGEGPECTAEGVNEPPKPTPAPLPLTPTAPSMSTQIISHICTNRLSVFIDTCLQSQG